jgi:colicin import membrane protein
MTKTTEPTDLAASLSQAQAEEQAAAALEAQAAEQRAKAAAALARAQAEQEAARRTWAERTLTDEPERRDAAVRAVHDAQAAFEESPGHPETIIPTWMQLQRARAALFGVERSRERAQTILGNPSREPKTPNASFSADVDRVLNRWALEQLGAAEEAANEALAAVTAGKDATGAK